MHRPGRRTSYPLITLAVPFLSWLLIVETHPFSFTICRPVSLQRARFLMTRHLSGHSLWNSKVVAEEPLMPPQHAASSGSLQVFSTCPSSSATADGYLEKVIRTARWSERAGCTGILIYTDNSLVDPWLISQSIIENTRALCPLIAVQP